MVDVQRVASDIGARIEKVIWFEYEQRQLDPDDAAQMRKEASMPGSSPHYRYRSAKQVAKNAAAKKGTKQLAGWIPTHKVRVGLYMLEVARSAGVISWDKVIKYGKNQTVVYSNEFMNEILGYEDLLMARAFHAYPLVDTPLDWKVDSKPSRFNKPGGYHLPELRQDQRLCRSYESDSVFADKAIDLLDTLQKTAWRVDDSILAVVEVLNENVFQSRVLRLQISINPSVEMRRNTLLMMQKS